MLLLRISSGLFWCVVHKLSVCVVVSLLLPCLLGLVMSGGGSGEGGSGEDGPPPTDAPATPAAPAPGAFHLEPDEEKEAGEGLDRATGGASVRASKGAAKLKGEVGDGDDFGLVPDAGRESRKAVMRLVDGLAFYKRGDIWVQADLPADLEKKTIALATELKEQAWSPVHKQLLGYLLQDEMKHDQLLEQLKEIKTGMDSASGG